MLFITFSSFLCTSEIMDILRQLLAINELSCNFLRTTAVPAGTAVSHISYGDSVRLFVRPSRPGTDSRPGVIETPGLHRMRA